jgi:hypothetical protein
MVLERLRLDLCAFNKFHNLYAFIYLTVCVVVDVRLIQISDKSARLLSSVIIMSRILLARFWMANWWSFVL